MGPPAPWDPDLTWDQRRTRSGRVLLYCCRSQVCVTLKLTLNHDHMVHLLSSVCVYTCTNR